jgi:hypothetical protein
MRVKTVVRFEDVVRAVQDTAWSDAEAVAVITHLLTTHRLAYLKPIRRITRPAPIDRVVHP